MPSLRSLLTSLVTSLAVLAALAGVGSAQAQTKITIGKVVGGNGLHIPSYVADVAGIFKQEGLEARFISSPARRRLRRDCPATSISCRSPRAARRPR